MALMACMPGGYARANPAQLIDGAQSMRSSAVRLRLARDLVQEISAVLRRIGAPAAGESAAVVEELAAIERLRDANAVNARAQRLYASATFQQLRLVNTLAVVRDALDCAASAYGPLKREMACWAIAAANLADRSLYDDALDVLLASGRLPYGGGYTRARWFAEAERWARYGIAIQDYITIPFLSGALD